MSKDKKHEKHEKESKFIVILNRPITLVIIIVIAAFLIVGKIKFGNPFWWLAGKEGETTTITQSELIATLEISELSTVEYAYNTIATAYKEDSTDIRYYVAYDGTVKAGIDFSEVKFDIDEEKKIITATLPEVQILDTSVDIGSMQYIFTKSKYETETVSQEAYSLCMDDLGSKARSEEKLLEYAAENSKSAIEGLLRPFIESVDAEYVIEWTN